MFWVAYPLDKVFAVMVMCSVVQDILDFIFCVVINGDCRGQWFQG